MNNGYWFEITWAVVFLDVVLEDDMIKIPTEPRDSYRYAIYFEDFGENGMIFVSENGKDFVIAVAVYVKGSEKPVTAISFKDGEIITKEKPE